METLVFQPIRDKDGRRAWTVDIGWKTRVVGNGGSPLYRFPRVRGGRRRYRSERNVLVSSGCRKVNERRKTTGTLSKTNNPAPWPAFNEVLKSFPEMEAVKVDAGRAETTSTGRVLPRDGSFRWKSPADFSIGARKRIGRWLAGVILKPSGLNFRRADEIVCLNAVSSIVPLAAQLGKL